MLQQNRKAESQKWGKQDGCRVNLPPHIIFRQQHFSVYGLLTKIQDSKPSANTPISTIVRPSSHDTSCSLPSRIVLNGSFSPSEHCLLTTRNFSAHNFLRFFYESPTFISFLTLRSGRHICLQTFAWHIFLARSSRTRTQRLLEMLRKVAHKQLARTSLNIISVQYCYAVDGGKHASQLGRKGKRHRGIWIIQTNDIEHKTSTSGWPKGNQC